MKVILDTNILYYTTVDENNPLNKEKVKKKLSELELIFIPSLNLLEFFLSDTLSTQQKISILEMLKKLRVEFEGISQEKNEMFINSRIEEINSSNFDFAKQQYMNKKIEIERQILVEFAESIVAIFNIYLNLETPLLEGKQSLFYIRQMESLLKGNKHFTDEELFNSIEQQYKTKINKNFRKSFIDYVYILIYISIQNFSASKAEVYFHDILNDDVPQDVHDKFKEYLDNSQLFKKIQMIMEDKATDTKLPFDNKEKKAKLAEALKEYSQYLKNFPYPESYIINISNVFNDIFIEGSKIEKNDIIDNMLFLYLDKYDILTFENKIRNRIKKVNSESSERLEKVLVEMM